MTEDQDLSGIIQTLPIGQLKPNKKNPRIIKDDRFKKLVKSLQDFPGMMKLRPIVVDESFVILGGNMRFRAAQEAGWKEVPTIQATDLTPEQKEEFIVKDNVAFGEWDWDAIMKEWSAFDTENWGLTEPKGWDAPELLAPAAPAAKEAPIRDSNPPVKFTLTPEDKAALIDCIGLVGQLYGKDTPAEALMQLVAFFNQHHKTRPK